VARHNELDAGPAERLDDIEILFTGYAEDPLDAFILQSSDKQVRTPSCAGLAHRPATVGYRLRTSGAAGAARLMMCELGQR
jgi:hypothetical protein